MLKEMIRHAGNSGTREVVLGMAHRGRLNVLVNVLGKKPQDLFDEFAGKHKEHLGTGDVKYHMGFSSDFQTDGGLVHLALAFNPSHLEIVSPVVIGSVRARLDRLDEPSSNKVLPITIHGDAAVTGQGVVQETLNMSKARGYEVGGTVRIVINNQVGFTTSNPLDARSTPYCTDIGKMVQAPIFHVNADDPEAVAFVTRLALDFRNTFKRDVFIDLVCYRRHGHNEADEPSATQPLMYQKIKKHPTPRKIYADKLEQEKVATLEDATEMVNLYRDALDAGDCVVAEWRPMNMHSFTWSPYLNHEWDEEYPNKVEMKRLQELAKRISTVPEAVEMQSRVAKIYGDRQAMAAGEKLFDWGGCTKEYDFDSIVTDNVTIYPKWLKMHTVTIDGIDNKVIDGNTAVKPLPSVKDGYVFKGWYSDSEYNNKFDFNEPIRGDIAIYSKWVKLVTVSVDNNKVLIESGTVLSRPDMPIKNGYTFAGWYSDEACTKEFDFAKPLLEDVTIYTKWKKVIDPMEKEDQTTSINSVKTGDNFAIQGYVLGLIGVMAAIVMMQKKYNK